MKNKSFKRILSIILALVLTLGMLVVPAYAEDDNELEIISSVCVTAVTPTTISVKKINNVYYSLDNTTDWTTDATFYGLYPNTQHKVYYRFGTTGTPKELATVTTKESDYITKGATSIDTSATNTISLSVTHNVAFEDSFSLIYYLPVNSVASYSNVRLLVQKEVYATGASTCTYSSSVYDVKNLPHDIKSDGTDRYMLVYRNISSTELGDTLYLTIYAEDANGVTYISSVSDEYSIEKYCYNNLGKSSVSTGLKAMLVDVLNYGTEAQVYFNHPGNHYVNKSLTTDQKALASNTVYTDWTNCKNSIGSGDITITSNNVSFANTTNLVYYITVPGNTKSYDVSGLSLDTTYDSANPKNGTIKKSIPSSQWLWDSAKSRYTVTLYGISPLDFGCEITAKVMNASGGVKTQVSNTRIYSIESYCTNNSAPTSTTSAGLKTLILSLMKYSYSAREYFK